MTPITCSCCDLRWIDHGACRAGALQARDAETARAAAHHSPFDGVRSFEWELPVRRGTALDGAPGEWSEVAREALRSGA